MFRRSFVLRIRFFTGFTMLLNTDSGSVRKQVRIWSFNMKYYIRFTSGIDMAKQHIICGNPYPIRGKIEKERLIFRN